MVGSIKVVLLHTEDVQNLCDKIPYMILLLRMHKSWNTWDAVKDRKHHKPPKSVMRGTKKLLCFHSWSWRKSSTLLKTVHPHLWTNRSIWTELGLHIACYQYRITCYKIIIWFLYGMASHMMNENYQDVCLVHWFMSLTLLALSELLQFFLRKICSLLFVTFWMRLWRNRSAQAQRHTRSWELKSCGLVIGMRICRVNLHRIQCFCITKQKPEREIKYASQGKSP
jgi:hypothetical protein